VRWADPFWHSVSGRRSEKNDRGFAVRILGGDCGPLGDFCGHPELPRRDADQALEVMAELALVHRSHSGPRVREVQAVDRRDRQPRRVEVERLGGEYPLSDTATIARRNSSHDAVNATFTEKR
jgi:hypothetical protein